MKGFCISLDVSKGSSFYQGFKGLDEPITKPKKIEHNLEGFKELLNLKEKIKKLWGDKKLCEAYSKNCKNISFDTIDEYYEKIMKVYCGENKQG